MKKPDVGTVRSRFVLPQDIDTAESVQLTGLVNAAFGRHRWLFPVERTTAEGFVFEVAGKELLLLEVRRNRPVAMAAFEVEGTALHFGMAVVEPSGQGLGLGQRLVSILEDVARQRDLGFVELDTVREIGNEAYYARLGYVTLREQRCSAGMWGALQPFTLVRMRKPT